MLLHLHPETDEAFIRISTHSRDILLYSLFKEKERTINIGRVEVPCIETYCENCEQYELYSDRSEDIDEEDLCQGGESVIKDEGCLYYGPEDLYLGFNESIKIKTPQLLFVNRINKYKGKVYKDYLFTVREVNSSYIAVSPFRIGNVDECGNICWGFNVFINEEPNANEGVDILRRWEELWATPFNSDFATNLHCEVGSTKEYIEEYSKLHKECEEIINLPLENKGKLIPLDLKFKSIFLWGENYYPIKDNKISISSKELFNLINEEESIKNIVCHLKNKLLSYSL